MKNPIKQLFTKKESKKSKSLAENEESKPLVFTEQHQPESFARATRHWDVKIPPAQKTMVGGVMIPTFESVIASLLRQERRISLEVHCVKEQEGGVDPDSLQKLLRGESLVNNKDKDLPVLREEEYVLLKVLRPVESSKQPHNENKAASSTEKSTESTKDSPIEFHTADEPECDDHKNWTEVAVCDLDDIEILKTRGQYCQLRFGRGTEAEIRTVRFGSILELETFLQVLGKLEGLESKRTKQRVEKYYASHPKNEEEKEGMIHMVVEIVSGINLPVADIIVGSDPYVVVRLGAREVHCTKSIPDTVNPIWTIDSGAYCLFSATPEEFFASSSGLTFVVKNFDPFGRDAIMGIVVVTQEELLEGTGERKEYPLEFGEFEAEDGSTRTGKLVLRFRQATKHDKEFMERLWEFQQGKQLHSLGAEKVLPNAVIKSGEAVINFSRRALSEQPGVYWAETFVPPRVFSSGRPLSKKTKKDLSALDGPSLIRVKPEPDPERPKDTKWLTSTQIEAESQKTSTVWTETGTGDLGKLFVEVIGCDDLPNLDALPLVGDVLPGTNVLTGGKTDSFACLVFEDCIVNTDVINDCLSPRWMPWSQRAFIFRIMHPSSQLMVGVFDFDSEMPGARHEAIGRVTVDISNFRPRTTYTLYYNLYTSALTEKRTATGQVKLRMRMEFNDARKVTLATMDLPPQFYVNVATRRDYDTARFTCEGKYDTDSFALNTLTEHVDEIQDYKALIPVLREAVFSVLLWRGHFPCNVRVLRCPPLSSSEDRRFVDRFSRNVTILLPIHSLSVFVVGVMLSENYNLLPSFILFAISWLLFATSGSLSDDPSPWRQPIPFFQLSKALFIGRLDPETIEPFQNKDEIEKHEAQKEEFKRQLDAEAERKAAIESHELMDGELAAMSNAEEVKMATKKESKGLSLNPLEPVLFPVQQNLHKVCIYLRITRSLITWQEPFYAFWICISCLAMGIVFLVVPWAFLVRWAIRIVVWTFLGPWMKLVDILIVKRIQSDEEIKEAEAAQIRRKLKELRGTATSRQTKREDMTKLKHLKRYMFGQYLLELPRFKESRYVDMPLAASHCSPFVADDEASNSFKASSRKYGQRISGSIIPKREVEKSLWERSSLSKSDGNEAKNYGSTVTK